MHGAIVGKMEDKSSNSNIAQRPPHIRVAVGVENWIHLTYDVKAKGRVGHVGKWSRRSDQNVPTDTHTHTRTCPQAVVWLGD